MIRPTKHFCYGKNTQADACRQTLRKRLHLADSVVSFGWQNPRRSGHAFDSLVEYETHTGMSLLIFSKNRTKTHSHNILRGRKQERIALPTESVREEGVTLIPVLETSRVRESEQCWHNINFN